MSVLALTVALASIAVVAMAGGAAVLALVTRWWQPRTPGALGALLLLPIVLAAIAVFAMVLPSLGGACHCLQHGPHHPHICLNHPALSEPLLLPGVVLLTAWALLVGPLLRRLVLDVRAAGHWRAQVVGKPPIGVDGIEVRLAECGELGAVTVGVVRPAVVMDPTLWSALAPQERSAVIHHEACHVRERDGFSLVALRLAHALMPLPSSLAVFRAWRQAVERRCDAYSAGVLEDAPLVAQALISVEKYRQTATPAALTLSRVLSVAPGYALEDRVHALLALPGGTSSSRLVSLWLAIGVLAACAVIPVLFGERLHHVVETLMGLLLGHP